jgi:hypothetical protein
MHSLLASFALGYHGCEREIGEAVLRGETTLQQSENDHDWLGPGIYFWEANPHRGIEWAREMHARDKIKDPYVIGGIIDFGYCLDLMSQNAIDAVKVAYQSLKHIHSVQGFFSKPLPQNVGGDDKLARRLDCAVIRHLHRLQESQGKPSFGTVRGLFREGDPIYPDAGFYEKSHIQIAVCKPARIKGYFRVGL